MVPTIAIVFLTIVIDPLINPEGSVIPIQSDRPPSPIIIMSRLPFLPPQLEVAENTLMIYSPTAPCDRSIHPHVYEP